jgi:hypothetical protein
MGLNANFTYFYLFYQGHYLPPVALSHNRSLFILQDLQGAAQLLRVRRSSEGAAQLSGCGAAHKGAAQLSRVRQS